MDLGLAGREMFEQARVIIASNLAKITNKEDKIYRNTLLKKSDFSSSNGSLTIVVLSVFEWPDAPFIPHRVPGEVWAI